MIKRIICCPKCNEDITIEEKEESITELAKRAWAKKSEPDQVKELREISRTWGIKKEPNMKTTNNKVGKFNKELKNILENHKISPYEKKVNLFNLVKDLDVGELQPLKEQRMNYLLESRLYDMLAKKALEDYKKTTAKFSKDKRQL